MAERAAGDAAGHDVCKRRGSGQRGSGDAIGGSFPLRAAFPPPLAECVVVEPRQYRTKLHPLSLNSTTTEHVHYIDHTVHAPAMTLEHLVDQYWFPGVRPPHLGKRPGLAPLVPRAVPGWISVVGQSDFRPTAAGRNARASAAARATGARSSHRGGASADCRFRQAQLRPLSARHRAADRSRREDARAYADVDLTALAAGVDRPAQTCLKV